MKLFYSGFIPFHCTLLRDVWVADYWPFAGWTEIARRDR